MNETAAPIDIKSLKKQISEDIARALGLERCPAFLTEYDLEIAGIQKASKSQHYRAHGGSGALPFIKHGHKILYPVGAVINALSSHAFTHTGAYSDTAKRTEAIRQNLAKAHRDKANTPDE